MGTVAGRVWSFFLPALIVALLVDDLTATPDAMIAAGQRRQCPHCAEAVRWQASVCPHCHRDIVLTAPVAPGPDDELTTPILEAARRPRSADPTTEAVAESVGGDPAHVGRVLQHLEEHGQVVSRHPVFGT